MRIELTLVRRSAGRQLCRFTDGLMAVAIVLGFQAKKL